MRILGISCFYHDSAACLLRDGRVVAAAEEERFTRLKHDQGFAVRAIRYCLDADGASPSDLDYVVFYEKPLLKFERILSTCTGTFPTSRALFVRGMRQWLTRKLWIRDQIRKELGAGSRVVFGEHHVSHAASAYFPSPFSEAATVTADGVGEWATATIGRASGIDLELSHEIRFPHSLGLLYSAFTAYLGFEVNEGEYKVMGMSAFGVPRHVDKVRKLVSVAADGSFSLDLKYFGFQRGVHTLSSAFVELFGPPRSEESALEGYADIAASIQVVVEEAMLAIARHARTVTGMDRLCLAGGVALNVLANSRVLREAGFRDVWIQPAAGDSGGCIGAATYLYHTVLRQEHREPLDTAYLGPCFSDTEIDDLLRRERISFTRLTEDSLIDTTARLLAEGHVIGWLQGRMEFGPRALGARSILASPIEPHMKDKVNAKIKHREPFRPFAPAVTLEAAHRYFEIDPRDPGRSSPFMLFVARVKPEGLSVLPAVTHVDGTARVQTVSREQNPLFYRLIQRFGELTGVPVLLNTSFNVRGEPIVCSPADAFNSFSHTDMDFLCMGTALIPATSKQRTAPYPGRRDNVSASADVQL